jgi:muramoyltetrapeptide carboxypeptidase
MLILPEHLNPGDVVGLVAPASAPPRPQVLERAAAVVEDLGFKLKLGRHVRKRWGFLAGPDRDRARDLMDMFADRTVRAILSVRGGYGTARLLPLLDYRFIRAHPKIFVGYSDITSLHCAFLTQANLLSFHGPMFNSDFVKSGLPEFTRQSFLRTLMEPTAPGSVSRGCRQSTVRILRGGTASGRLMGGNLSILCATLGTPYQPDFRGRILFFEDVDEVPYRFDRMLTHLLNAGLLQQVAGVAIGQNRNCKDPKAARTHEYRQTLEDVFKERLLPLRVPVLTGLPFGHVRYNATLPVGAKVTLSAQRRELRVCEAVVR